jgi:hypothetical protein
MSTCRLCAAADPADVIEHVAERMWEDMKLPDDPTWADVGEYWQGRFRELATSAAHILSGE